MPLEKIKAMVIKIICRAFCLNQSNVPLPIKHFTYVLKIISSVLESDSNLLKQTVIRHTKLIFTLDYRGVFILVPLYIREIEKIINENNFKTDKKYLKSINAAATILGSLIVVSDCFTEYKNSQIDTSKFISCSISNLKKDIYRLIVSILKNHKAESDENRLQTKMINKGICCLTLSLYQEIIKAEISFKKLSVYYIINQ